MKAGNDDTGKEGPPSIDFSGAAGFSEGFVPSDFLKMHEKIIKATAAEGRAAEELAEIGAAMADEIQRTYMLRCCLMLALLG